jgi:ubiquinone/menaquinone biosynthesis C-methylase UbiE
MVSEAQRLAQTLEVDNAAFLQGDAERLPFAPHTFDIVTCKLAFHYFPHPQVALAEIRRVTTPKGRVVLVDRVSAEDPVKRAYQNRVEKLRTPAKTYVYSESELVQALEAAGFVIDERASYTEHMDVAAWIQAAGPDPETAQEVLTLVTAAGDPAGLQIRREGDRLMLRHQTSILLARRQ